MKHNAFTESAYLTKRRFASYYYQFKEIIEFEPETVLEIGHGNGIISFLLKTIGVNVTTLDCLEYTKPDILGTVTDIPAEDNSFDLVACFQVLEHLPFEQTIQSLKEINRVSRKYAVISLPDCRLTREISIKLFRYSFFYRYETHKISNSMTKCHEWEINRNGYPLSFIIETIESVGFAILNTYRLKEYTYHRMFVLKKNNCCRKV